MLNTQLVKAQWVENGLPVKANFKENSKYNIVTCTDNQGGTIIAWSSIPGGDSQWGGGSKDIHIQRIDSTGNIVWSGDSTSVCATDGLKKDISILPDCSGGAFISWFEPSPEDKYYAQHISNKGNILWAQNGLLIFSDVKYYGDKGKIVQDNHGGIIFSALMKDDNIYLQRINGSGTILWPLDGIKIESAYCKDYSIASDESGGVFIIWHYLKYPGTEAEESKLFVTYVDNNGKVNWNKKLFSKKTSLNNPQIIYDFQGGAIILWRDYRDKLEGMNSKVIYAQKIDKTGNVKWLKDGIQVYNAILSEKSYDNNSSWWFTFNNSTFIADGSGGFVITWCDYKNERTTKSDIYAQHIDANGVYSWGTNGINLCSAEGDQINPYIITTSDRNYLISWWDNRAKYENNNKKDLYIQKINQDGSIVLMTNGVKINNINETNWFSCRYLKFIPDDCGGAYLIYQKMYINDDIYVSKLSSTGSILGIKPKEALTENKAIDTLAQQQAVKDFYVIEKILNQKGVKITGSIWYLVKVENLEEILGNSIESDVSLKTRIDKVKLRLRKYVDIDITVMSVVSNRLEYYRSLGLNDFLEYNQNDAVTLIQAFGDPRAAYNVFLTPSLENAIETLMRHRVYSEQYGRASVYDDGIERLFGYQFRKALDKICIPH